jgi:hypothetical protein
MSATRRATALRTDSRTARLLKRFAGVAEVLDLSQDSSRSADDGLVLMSSILR